jgi:hypothetical protein
MLRAKAPEKPSEAGRQIGAAAVAAALGLDEPTAPTPNPSPPPDDPKPQSNIEALVHELAKTVAGRDLAERKAIIAQARSAFEAARRSAMPPPGESAVMRDLKAFDAAAAGVIADPPQPAAAAPAEIAALAPQAAPRSSEVTPNLSATRTDAPKAEQTPPPTLAAVDRENENIAGKNPPRLPRVAAPVWLRITLRVLIAAWLALGAILGYAYLRHPTVTAPPTSSVPASPPASAPVPPAPASGKELPVPDPLIPIE